MEQEGNCTVAFNFKHLTRARTYLLLLQSLAAHYCYSLVVVVIILKTFATSHRCAIALTGEGSGWAKTVLGPRTRSLCKGNAMLRGSRSRGVSSDEKKDTGWLDFERGLDGAAGKAGSPFRGIAACEWGEGTRRKP